MPWQLLHLIPLHTYKKDTALKNLHVFVRNLIDGIESEVCDETDPLTSSPNKVFFWFVQYFVAIIVFFSNFLCRPCWRIGLRSTEANFLDACLAQMWLGSRGFLLLTFCMRWSSLVLFIFFFFYLTFFLSILRHSSFAWKDYSLLSWLLTLLKALVQL